MQAIYIDNGADVCVSNARAKQTIVLVNYFLILTHIVFAYHNQPLLNYTINVNIYCVKMFSTLMLLNLYLCIRTS